MHTLFDQIKTHYKIIQQIPDTPISYGSLANGNWGYLIFIIDDDYMHFDDHKKAHDNYYKYLKQLLKEQETEQTIENDFPW